jgi:hypothetical protein
MAPCKHDIAVDNGERLVADIADIGPLLVAKWGEALAAFSADAEEELVASLPAVCLLCGVPHVLIATSWFDGTSFATPDIDWLVTH